MLTLLLSGIAPQSPDRIVLAVPSAGQGTGFSIRADKMEAVTVDPHGEGLVWAIRGGKPSAVQRFAIDPIYAGAKDFTNYQGTAYQLALSPDGKRLVVLHPQTHGYRLYDLHPFRLVWERPSKDLLSNPTWTPRGDAVLFQGQTSDRYRPFGTLVSPQDGHERPFPMWGPYAFTADGRRVAGFTEAGAALAQLSTGRVLRRFQEPLATLAPIGISPDEKYLVTGGENPDWKGPGLTPDGGAPSESAYVHDYRIKIWSTVTGKRKALLPGYWQNNAHPLDPTFLPGGKVAFLGLGQTFRLSNGRSAGKFKPIEDYDYGFQTWWKGTSNPLQPEKGQLPTVSMPPNFVKTLPSSRLAMISSGYFWAFDLASGKPLTAKKIMPVNGVRQIVPRKDGSLIVSGLNGIQIFSADLRQNRLVRAPAKKDAFGFPSSERGIVLPGGNEVLATEPMGGTSSRWAVDTGKILGDDPRKLLPSESILFGPDGAAYRVRNWPSDASIARLGPSNRPKPTGDPTDVLSPASIEMRHGRDASWFTPRKYIVNGPQFSQDGKLIALIEFPTLEQQEFRLLDAETGRERWKTDLGAAGEFVLAPDASWFAVCRPNGVEILSIGDKKSRFIPTAMPEGAHLVTLSPGRIMLYGHGIPATVFDVNSGLATARLALFIDGDWAAWTPDGAADGSHGGLSWLKINTPGGLTPVNRDRTEAVWKAITGTL